MTSVIVVSAIKGGVGKTAVSVNLAGALSCMGYSVLLADFDPQGNITHTFGTEGARTVVPYLQKRADLQACVTPGAEFDLLLSSPEMFLIGQLKRTGIYADMHALDYEYIVLDTPPSVGPMSIAALQAGDYVVNPARQDSYSVEAVGTLAGIVADVAKRNHALKFGGVVINQYRRSRKGGDRTRDTATEALQAAAAAAGTKVYAEYVRPSEYIPALAKTAEEIRATEPPSILRDGPHWRPPSSIVRWKPKCAASKSFMKLAREIIADIGKTH